MEIKELIKKYGLEKPFNSYTKKKYTVLVKDKDGKIVRVHFGQKGAEDFRMHKDKKRRESFRNRHNCDDKKEKTRPGYWNCNWSW